MGKQLTEKNHQISCTCTVKWKKLPSTINLNKSKGMTLHDSQKVDGQMRV